MKNILVVDDDPSILDGFGEMLSDSGYSIGKAADEREALSSLDKNDYHVAIVDIFLKDSSGLDLIDKIKSRIKDIRIITITGNPYDEYERESLDRGAFSFLNKPCKRDVLLDSIDKAVNFRETSQIRTVREEKTPVAEPVKEEDAEEIDFGIDESMVAEFVDESARLLEDAANMFINLESNPADKEAIDTIFRTVHTIKGNSSFFNFVKIKSMAHVMEDLMSLVREETVKFNGGIADVLIRGTDYLNGMLKDIKINKPEVSDELSYNALLSEITRLGDSAKKQDGTSIWKDIDKEIRILEQTFSSSSSGPNDNWQRLKKDLVLLSPLYNKDVDGAQEESENIAEVDPKSVIENILSISFDEKLEETKAKAVCNRLKALKSIATDDTVELVDNSLEAYNSIFPKEGFTTFLAEIIGDNIKNVQIERRKDKLVERSMDKMVSEKSDKTMRVYESSIDEFLDNVGELVVVGEMYNQVYDRFATEFGAEHNTTAVFKKNNTFLNDLSFSLQKSVLAIRRIPIKSLTQRALRIVRDIALAKKKEIKVKIEGEDTLIDKSLLEKIEGPFVHMVRNSADHGVECVEERIKNGKNGEGTVNIRIFENQKTLFVEIKDDGAGINKQKIVDKAVKNGLIPGAKAENLSEQEIFHLLFAPGLSTAEEITDISGRGVGMDVVKQSIESINGQIHIESVLTQGSVFTLEIPKKVAINIMDGFLVLCDGSKFVLPMTSVGESFEISIGDIVSSPGEGECVLRHNKVFPVMRLDELLGFSCVSGNKQKYIEIGVVICLKKRDFVLLVDKILGVQRVVVKNIENLPGQPGIIAGGVILGDERVALVLNLDGVFADLSLSTA